MRWDESRRDEMNVDGDQWKKSDEKNEREKKVTQMKQQNIFVFIRCER